MMSSVKRCKGNRHRAPVAPEFYRKAVVLRDDLCLHKDSCASLRAELFQLLTGVSVAPGITYERGVININHELPKNSAPQDCRPPCGESLSLLGPVEETLLPDSSQ